QSETALAKELLRSQALFNTSIDGVVLLDAWGNVVQSSPSFARMLGYTVEEILTLNVVDWDAQWNVEELQQILRGTIPLPDLFETRHRRKDGSLYDVEISYSHTKLGEEIIHFCSCRDISDRKRIEAERQRTEFALQKSEERLQLALEASGDGLWDWNIVTGEVYYSPQYMTMLGYEADELPHNFETWTYLTHSDDQTWVLDQLNAHMRDSSQQYSFDYRVRTKSGTWKWIANYGKVVARDAQGNPLRMIGTHRDVSDRKQIEANLRESEERWQLALRGNNDGIWDWNVQTNQVFFSSRWKEMLGFADHEITNSLDEWSKRVHPDDLRRVMEVIQNHFAKETPFYISEHRVQCKDGSYKWILDRGQALWDEAGNVIRMTGSHTDISDRKQAETELKHQKDMLQTIVNHIPVMIALFNIEGRIEYVNPEFERVLGWSLADWQQQNVLLECYPDPAYYKTVIDHMVAVNGSWKDFTTLTKTGQAIETSWTNVRLSNGSNLGIGQDISDRKHKEAVLQQAMEAAEAANLAKSMFLANMSHELRTPLNVILGFTQVMTHDSSLTPAQLEDLQTIQRSSDHLLSLINDVLDLSKIEAGHYTLEESGFDLISLLHTLRTMMVERAKAKQLQLTFEIAPDVPQFVIADEQKLRQVLLNLLSNAVKFTKQGSVTLRVTSWESSEKTCLVPNSLQADDSLNYSNSSVACTLQFEVADTGVGIAAIEQEAIFDAFTQAEAGRKSMGGTGLGLTISRKLLELMDGSVLVESTPGLGSTFTVTVPVCPTSGVGGQVEQQERTIIGLAPGQPHRRILVVDDQRENRMLMVRLLTHLGLEVQEATDGREAIALWQQWKPDLTWMDIRMPGLDGYEATKQIRAMEQEQASIIIALTAQASQSDRALALAAGCNDYISK
ncbi:histidine kinase, partial [filamentous cyanobacterium CCP1]